VSVRYLELEDNIVVFVRENDKISQRENIITEMKSERMRWMEHVDKGIKMAEQQDCTITTQQVHTASQHTKQ
jgi:hypothetical protein